MLMTPPRCRPGRTDDRPAQRLFSHSLLSINHFVHGGIKIIIFFLDEESGQPRKLAARETRDPIITHNSPRLNVTIRADMSCLQVVCLPPNVKGTIGIRCKKEKKDAFPGPNFSQVMDFIRLSNVA